MFSSSRFFRSWFHRWKKPVALFLAVVCPGVPQLLRKDVAIGSILGILGTGALIQLISGGLWLSVMHSNSEVVFRSFDILYNISMPNLSRAFPNLKAFAGESSEYLIQPWFWELLVGYLLVYAVCALLSGWQQWKYTHAMGRSAPSAGQGR